MALKEQLHAENEQLQKRPAVDKVPFELEKLRSLVASLKTSEHKLRERLLVLEAEKHTAFEGAKSEAERFHEREVKALRDELDGHWRADQAITQDLIDSGKALPSTPPGVPYTFP